MKINTLVLISALALTNHSFADCDVTDATPIYDARSSAFQVERTLRFTSCNLGNLFGDVKSGDFYSIHDKDRCENISMCRSNIDEVQLKAAEEMIQEKVHQAVLLSIFLDQFKNLENKFYNQQLLKYENKNKVSVCPKEIVEESCEKDFREILNLANNNLEDFPKFNKSPSSKDKLETFVANEFVLKTKVNPPVSHQADYTKVELKKNCSNKMSFNQMCKARDARLDVIKKCTAGCFNKEQSGFAAIFNDYKNQKDVFMAIESQLCSANRIVELEQNFSIRPNSSTAMAYTSAKPGLLGRDGLQKPNEIKPVPTATTDDYPQRDNPSTEMFGPPAPTGVARNSLSLPETAISALEPYKSAPASVLDTVVPLVTPSNTPQANAPWSSGLDNFQSSTLAAQVASSANANVNEDGVTVTANETNTKVLENEITGLKNRLKEMTDKLDKISKDSKDSKDTKDTNGNIEESDSKTEKDNKEIADNEKAILDLKNQIAKLELDKKKQEQISKANVLAALKKENDHKLAAQNNENNISNFSTGSLNNRSPASGADYNNSNSSQSAVSQAIDYRAPASVAGQSSAAPTSSNTSNLKLSMTTLPNENGSSVMTESELKNYPYKLSPEATVQDIAELLKRNNGASIIIGDSEQIIPVKENGIIQHEADGSIKFKRVKMSLVKDQKNVNELKKANLSLPDLKRKEEENAKAAEAAARYKQMRDAVKIN